jgi:hypothetical protein
MSYEDKILSDIHKDLRAIEKRLADLAALRARAADAQVAGAGAPRPGYISTAEAGRIMGNVSVQRVRGLIHEGRLDGVRGEKNEWLVSAESVARFEPRTRGRKKAAE